MQPQYPPQQYGPPPQYGPPQGYPPPQQYGYPPQQQNYQAPSPSQTAPAGPPPASSMPNFVTPLAPGSSLAPKIYDLAGCLVALRPVKFTAAGTEDNLTGYTPKDQPSDRVTVDIYLLESPNGQVAFGGEQKDGVQLKPNTHTVATPARFMSVWLNNTTIVRAVKAELDREKFGQVPGMPIGRVKRSDVGNRPWNLEGVEGTPDLARAAQIWQAANSGQLQWAEPIALAPQGPPPGSVQYGAPGPVSPVGQPSYPYPPPPAQPHYPQGLGGPQQYGAPAEVVQQWTGAPPQQWGPPAQPPPPGPQPMPSIPMPPGWNPAVWAGFTEQQKAEIVGGMQAQQGPPPQATPWGNPPQQ